jgi:hypothetical protein
VTVAWDRQSGEVHEAVSADVMAGLVRRELLEPTTEPGSYRMVAEVAQVVGGMITAVTAP